MKYLKVVFTTALILVTRALVAQIITDEKPMTIVGEVAFYDASQFDIDGKYHNEKNYNRLPSTYDKIVRPEVFGLSKNSAGISVRFSTNSASLTVKWKLLANTVLKNMNKIGISGIDVYCLVNGVWQYVNTGIPNGTTNSAAIVSNMDTTMKDFLINLPLYDIVESVEIGVEKSAKIAKPQKNLAQNKKPIVFYGTSITQGGSASRPGMAYPSIISRKYNIETINLGFSGNGRFERSVGVALCEIDAAIYVLDCTPNSSPDTIRKNALNLIKQLRLCKPNTPILLVETILRENTFLNTSEESKSGGIKYVMAQNKALKSTYDEARAQGIKKVYYLEAKNLLGTDHEGTIDGTHLNDLGFSRIAEVIGKKIGKIIKL
ncbi:MAG TPA: SGNH/GDSL hydrolase family protein [Flavobacteriales bacterium]|nr:SGNH/GDSL hydrolase family protein [Flavobacteriales bacterium]